MTLWDPSGVPFEITGAAETEDSDVRKVEQDWVEKGGIDFDANRYDYESGNEDNTCMVCGGPFDSYSPPDPRSTGVHMWCDNCDVDVMYI